MTFAMMSATSANRDLFSVSQRQGNPFERAMPESRRLIDVLKHSATEIRQHGINGHEVRAMQRHARFHAGMLVRQLGAELQTFLPRFCQ